MLLQLLHKPHSSPTSKRNAKQNLQQVMGFLGNVAEPAHARDRAQHLQQLRMEMLFNGPLISLYLSYLKGQKELKNSTINQQMYFLRDCAK